MSGIISGGTKENRYKGKKLYLVGDLREPDCLQISSGYVH
jgi:hypothetical protein